VALGYIRKEDIPDLVEVKAQYQPDQSAVGIYREIFAEFLNLYRVHNKICRRLNKNNAERVCAPLR